MKIDLSHLKERWPSSIVARTKISDFSGGAFSGRTVANADSAGTGPKGRFRIGKKVVYPVDSLVAWLESRAN